MKKIYATVIAITALIAPSAQADLLADIKAKDTLVCGVLSNFEPYGFTDPKTREPVGYEVDMCRALAESIGVKPTFKVVTTQGRIPELLQGRVDVIAGLISYSAARAEQVTYSGVYMVGTNRFMVRSDSKFTSMLDLSGAKIGISKGSVLETFIREKMPKASAIGFDDKSASYLALKTGQVDALLSQSDTLASFKHRDPQGDAVKILPESIYPTRISFIFRPGEPAMLGQANAFLAKAEENGQGLKIWAKWFGAETDFKIPREFKLGEPANQ